MDRISVSCTAFAKVGAELPTVDAIRATLTSKLPRFLQFLIGWMTFGLDGCRLCRANSVVTILFPLRRVLKNAPFLVSLRVLPFVGVLAVLFSLFFFSLSFSLSLCLSLSLPSLSLSPFLFSLFVVLVVFFFLFSFPFFLLFFFSLFFSFSCLFRVSSLFLFFSSSLCFVSFPCRFLLLVLSTGRFCVCAGSSPCCMSSFRDEFLSFLHLTRQQCGCCPVNIAFAGLVKASWDILLKHALQLRDPFPRVRHLDNNGPRAFHTLKGALCDSVRFITAQADFLSSPTSDEASAPLCLKLGFGSPSATGCLDAHGVTVKMQVLLRHPTSIQAAFANTGLHAIGLAGVRLTIDFVCPVTADTDLFLWARLIATVLQLHSRMTFRVASLRLTGLVVTGGSG